MSCGCSDTKTSYRPVHICRISSRGVVLAGIFKIVFLNVGPVNEILQFFGMNTRLDFFSDGGLGRGNISCGALGRWRVTL